MVTVDKSRTFMMNDAWQKEAYDRSYKSYEDVRDFFKEFKTTSPNLYADWMDELVSLLHEFTITLGLINLKISDFSLVYLHSFQMANNLRPQYEVDSITSDLEDFYNKYIKIAIVEIVEFDFMRTKCDYRKTILEPNKKNFANANDMRPILQSIKTSFLDARNKIIEAKNSVEIAFEHCPTSGFRQATLNYRQNIHPVENAAKWAAIDTARYDVKSAQINTTKLNTTEIRNAKVEYMRAILLAHERIKFFPDIILDYFTPKPNRLWMNSFYLFDKNELDIVKNNLEKIITNFKEFKLNATSVNTKKASNDQVQWIDIAVRLLEADKNFVNEINVEYLRLHPKTIQYLIDFFKANPWTNQTMVNHFCRELSLFTGYFIPIERKIPDGFLNNKRDFKTEFFDRIKDKVCNLKKADESKLQEIIDFVYLNLVNFDKSFKTELDKEVLPFRNISHEIMAKLMEMRRIIQSKKEIDEEVNKNETDELKETFRQKINKRLEDAVQFVFSKLTDAKTTWNTVGYRVYKCGDIISKMTNDVHSKLEILNLVHYNMLSKLLQEIDK